MCTRVIRTVAIGFISLVGLLHYAVLGAPPESTLDLTLIQPGRFTMGATEVNITKPFYLGTFEVTQEQYERVMGVNPSRFKGDPFRPVERVSWFEAIDFCNRLSQSEDLPPYYQKEGEEVTVLGGEGYRLPTEAEWEYGCRAGSSTKYCFGDDREQLNQWAWFYGNADRATHPVGEKKPNNWGLYDIHGNVCEWCWDWYAASQASPSETSPRAFVGSYRVHRGGSWFSGYAACRSSYRNRLFPANRSYILGFRVARAVEE